MNDDTAEYAIWKTLVHSGQVIAASTNDTRPVIAIVGAIV